MKYIAVNYRTDPTWIKEYTYDFLIFDRSETEDWNLFPEHTKRTKNVGHVDYDKLTYLVENYDTLPEIFYWGKVNLWKSITREEFDLIKDTKEFTPILTKGHQEVVDRLGILSFYDSHGMYCERSGMWGDAWFEENDWKYYKSFPEFAHSFGFNVPSYVPFAPGGNYFLTKERVHKYSRDFYDEMRKMLDYSQLPIEAHFCERLYYLMWK